ncbi:MAG: beta strand repeat-containing protein, partial [Tepidisphaerales bacterium]
MESRTMLSTTVAAWNFDSLTIGTNLSPAPSTGAGTGTALTVGLQTSGSNPNSPGGVYAYPNPNASGTGDTSDILNGTGNNGVADHSSSGAGTGNINPAWRVRGASDGWSSNAALASQGAQFKASTVGSSGISLTFDLDPSSGGAPSEVAVQYTTDGSTWITLPASALTTGTAANGTTDGVTVATNSSDPNIVNGGYFQIANNADALFWQNGLKADLSGISAVNNNANFGVRIVNAATGIAEFEVTGTGAAPIAYPAIGTGNWRFDNVQILANGGALTAPVVSTNPTNQTVAAGQPVTFTAAAAGNPTPTVQWYKGAVGSGTLIGGATSVTYTFTTLADGSENGSTYYAVFTNSVSSVSTTAATLNDALAAPVVTTNPTNLSTTAGNTATFTAAASGSPLPTVQWQSSPNGTTWTDISGATATTYSFTTNSGENGNHYRAVFTNSQAPGGVPSSGATLSLGGTVITAWNFNQAPLVAGNVDLSPAPSTGSGTASSLGMGQPGNYTLFVGTQTSGTFTLTVTDNSGTYTTAALAYNATSAQIQTALRALGATGASGFTVAATQLTTAPIALSVTLTGDASGSLSGNGSALTTPGSFLVSLPPYPQANATGASGQAAVDISDLVASSGAGNGGSSDGTTGNIWRIRGNNGWNSNTPIGSQGAQFLASTTGFTSIGAQFDLYATAQGEGKIQVEYTTDGSTWNNVPAADLSVGSDTGISVQNNTTSANTVMGGYFKITGGSAWYNALQVNLEGIAAVDNDANFGLRIVNASTGADCVNVTGAALNNSSGNNRLDEVQITGSNPAAPIITTNPTSQSVASGSAATFTVAALGYPAPTVQWKVSTDGGTTFVNDTTDTGNTTTTLQVVGSTGNSGNEYEAVFTNAVGSTTTTAATLSVAPTITTQPVSQTVAAGATNVTFTAAATGNPAPTVQWKISTDGGATFTNISGATSTTYAFTATEGLSGNEYEAVFTNAGGSATTTAATLTVIGTPIAQWIFTGGQAPTAGGSTAQGTGNAPYATFGPLTNTAGTLGLQNFYTGVEAFPESDILIERSTLNPSYTEYDWRVRSGNGSGPTGSPGTPEGWSQTAPQWDAASIGTLDSLNNLILPQGVLFKVDTTGYSNITFQFDWNQGGISDMQPQYSPDGGTTWTNVPGAIIQAAGTDFHGITGATTTATPIVVNLQGISAANNNPNFELRLVTKYNPSLPLISDGNLLDPATHGQYATGAPAPVNAQQVIQFDTGVNGGTFTLTYNGNTTGPIAYGATPATLIANITAALDLLPGLSGNFSVAQTNYASGTLLQPVRDALGKRDQDMTVTFSGALAATAVTTMTADSSSLAGGGVSVATWVNGSANGFKPYVDGGGAWQIGKISINGDSTRTGGLSVTANPVATQVAGGGVATFTATVYSETFPTVQWQVSTDGGVTWNPATGTTTINGYSSTFSYTSHTNLSDNSYQFRAEYTAGASTADSSSAVLTVVTPVAPTITLQPANTSVQEGNVALITATANSNTAPAPTMQWQVSTDSGTTWTPLTDTGGYLGSQTVTLGPSGYVSKLSITTLADASQTGYEYRAVFTNAVSSATSNAATLTVLAAETIITNWDFSGHSTDISTPTSPGFDNAPAPTGGVVDHGTALPVGMTLAYNPADPATGTDGNGSVPAGDVLSSPGYLNPSFSENTWRVRGGPTASTGGTPANGWSNLAPEYSQGVQFSVPTTGYNHVYVTLDWYSTTSGILDAQEQYTTDGATWHNINNQVQAFSNDFYGATATGGPVPLVIDVSSISGAANNPNFGIRLVSAYNPQLPSVTTTLDTIGSDGTLVAGTIASTHGQYANAALVGNPPGPAAYNGSKGNWRFDNIVFHGDLISTLPAWLAPGSVASWVAGTHTLTVTGPATIIADPGTDQPVIDAAGAAAQITIIPATDATHERIELGGLHLTGGASAVVTSQPGGRSVFNHRVLVIDDSTQFSVDGTSTLDVKDNDVILRNASAGTISEVPEVKSTSVVAGSTALGFALNGTTGVNFSQFGPGASPQSVGATDFLIK